VLEEREELVLELRMRGGRDWQMIEEGAELLVCRYGAGSAGVATQTRARAGGPWMSVKGSRDILSS
jgi:hypothetical protein